MDFIKLNPSQVIANYFLSYWQSGMNRRKATFKDIESFAQIVGEKITDAHPFTETLPFTLTELPEEMNGLGFSSNGNFIIVNSSVREENLREYNDKMDLETRVSYQNAYYSIRDSIQALKGIKEDKDPKESLKEIYNKESFTKLLERLQFYSLALTNKEDYINLIGNKFNRIKVTYNGILYEVNKEDEELVKVISSCLHQRVIVNGRLLENK